MNREKSFTKVIIVGENRREKIERAVTLVML
jgi:hypothetical protein